MASLRDSFPRIPFAVKYLQTGISVGRRKLKGAYRAILFLLGLQVCIISHAQGQSAFYPEWKEVKDSLVSLQHEFPRIAAVRHVGRSTHGDLEIVALEITGRVQTKQDKPVWVLTGLVHGNEQLGLKVILNLAHELTAGYASDPRVKKWVDAYNIWLVPSMNPWGYVHYKRSNGIKTNKPTSGVDMNRNFGFRWKHGGSATPVDKHYRGSAPFSEKETQCMRDLFLRLQPVFGITFHQLNHYDGGQVMVPWGTRRTVPAAPDSAVLYRYANLYADSVYHSRKQGGLCEVKKNGDYVLEDPDGDACGDKMSSARYCKELCWRPVVTSLGPIGQSSNCYYAAAGTICFTMELSHRLFNRPFMHRTGTPKGKYDKTIMDIAGEIAKNNTDAIKAWFDHFLYKAEGGDYQYKGPGITGHITDKWTGKPVRAAIEVSGYTSPLIRDRKSDVSFGRFWRLLPAAGEYKIIVRAPGYAKQEMNVKVKDGPLTELNIRLSPVSDNS